MVARSDQPLVIASLKIAHVLMSQKKPFTLAESVVKPYLETVVQEIHGGATAHGCDQSPKAGIVK